LTEKAVCAILKDNHDEEPICEVRPTAMLLVSFLGTYIL
jgi:hypothetical protein